MTRYTELAAWCGYGDGGAQFRVAFFSERGHDVEAVCGTALEDGYEDFWFGWFIACCGGAGQPGGGEARTSKDDGGASGDHHFF